MTPPDGPQRLPYPGLRSFTREETDLFFGRDQAVHTMLKRLRDGRFLAVLGASGSGKSSLVRTGLLDGLELGLLADAGAWWRVIDIRPGSEPMRALAAGLCGPDAPPDEVDQMRAWLMRGPRALAEWAGQGRLQPGENLLVLVDQFEELFRYRGYDGHQEAEAFVALLLESARAPGVPLYVTLTMRSEYLGACALFDGLAEAMNEGQYLTPRMTRDQCRAAIEGPAAVCGFRIAPDLVSTLLNDLSSFAPWEDTRDSDLRAQMDMIGRRADQLPLLQHALNQLWLQARDRAGPGQDIVLEREYYLGLGGLQGTIDKHADRIWHRLSLPARAIGDQVFRALTSGATVAEAVRRPTRLGDIVASIGKDSRPQVIEVIEAYRAPGRNFLTPPAPAPLTDATTIDISHESLIRQWAALSGWLAREAQDADQMRRLDEAARRNADGSGELLSGRDLAPLAAWRRERSLSAAWARRYVAEPDQAFAFLDESLRAAARRKGARRLLVGAGAVAGLALAVTTTFFVIERNRGLLLETQNAELQAKRDELAAMATELQAGLGEMQAGIARLQEQADTLTDEAETLRQENAAFETTYAEIQRDKVVGLIHETLRDGNRQQAADQLGLLVQADPAAFAEDSPLRAPAVWLSALDRAFPRQQDNAHLTSGPLPFRTAEDAPESPFVLRTDTADPLTHAVVDARTGRVLHEFSIATDTAFGISRYAVSMSGSMVLLEDETGRLLRWQAGRDYASRVHDRAWLRADRVAQPWDRDIERAIFDETTGDVAITFRQHGARFVTVLPRGGAAAAKVWPEYRIDTALLAEMGTTAEEGQSLAPRVEALQDGKLVVTFDLGGSKGLARFNPTDGSASVVLEPGSLTEARPSTDPNLIHILMPLDPEDCRADPAARAALVLTEFQQKLNYCLSALDLRSSALTGKGRVLPFIGSHPDRAWLPLDPDSPAGQGGLIDASTGATMAAIRVADSPDDRAQDTALFDWWGVSAQDGRVIGFDYASIRAQTVPGGLVVWDQATWMHNRLDTRVVTGLDQGDPVPALSSDIASADATEIVQTMGTLNGEYLLGLDRDNRLFGYDMAQGAWGAPITVLPHASCGAQGDEPAPQPSKQDDGPPRPDLLPPAAFAEPVTPVQPLTLDGAWTLVRLTRPERLALLHLAPQPADAPPSGAFPAETQDGPTATLVCPPGLTMTAALAIDPVAGRMAVTDKLARRVVVWQLPSGPPASWPAMPVTLYSAAIPQDQSATAADFFGPASVAVLTSGDTLAVLPLRPGTNDPALDAPPMQRLALPEARRLSVQGSSVLIARSEAGGPAGEGNRWITLGVFAFDRPGMPGRITHAGVLPLAIPDIAGLRLMDATGGVEVVTNDAMIYRLHLPPAPAPDLLAADILSLASPEAVARNGQDAANMVISMLPSLRNADAADQAEANPAQTCAGQVQDAVWQLQGGTGAELPDAALAACGATGQPLASLLRDLAQAEPEAAFPPAVQSALHAAAAGDAMALRALLSTLQGDGLNDLFAAAEPVAPQRFAAIALLDGWTGPFALASPDSGDPEVQEKLAAQAEAAGDLVAAYRHAGRAERILSLTDAPPLWDMQALRLTLGARLPVAQRAAEARALRDWQPLAPTVASGPFSLDDDLAAIARLGTAFADPGAAALLQVARLDQERRATTDPARKAQLAERLIDLILSTDTWPARTATLTTLPDLMADLRRDQADPDRQLALDMAQVALWEANVDPLPFGLQRMALYADAVARLAVLPADRLAPLAGTLRFGTTTLSFNLRGTDFASTDQGFTILKAREALATALPDAPGSDIALASTPLWRGVILADQPDGVSNAGMRAQMAAYLLDAFWRMQALAKAGRLASFDDWNLLGAAAGWAVDHLTVPDILARYDDLLAVSGQLAALNDRVEATDATSAVWDQQFLRHRQFVEQIAYALSLAPGEPPLSEPDPERLQQMLKSLVFSEQWLRVSNQGGRNGAEDAYIDQPSEWSNAVGYAFAFAAARAPRTDPLPAPTDCDRFASSPFDPDRVAPGVIFDALVRNPDVVAACRAALAAATPDQQARLTFLLARAISSQNGGDPDQETLREALVLLVQAAEDGHAAALNNLAAQLNDTGDPFRYLYYQDVLLGQTARAHAALAPFATDERSKTALLAVLREAGKLGSLDAHLVLAQISPDPVDQATHLSIARQILRTDGPRSEAESELIGTIPLRLQDMPLTRAQRDLAGVMGETFVAKKRQTLDPGLIDYVRTEWTLPE